MKRRILFGLLVILSQLSIYAQSLNLETCQDKAKTNYPLIKEYELIEQTAQYNISNANKGYLPQLSISARSTYQSDAISINLNGRQLGQDKDQYQAVLEASQLIWDGGIISAQKKITDAGTELEKQKLEVDLFSLKDRVNQLYFGILLLKEQIIQNDILKTELETNFKRVKAYMQNGVANQSDIDVIKVEQLNANQRDTELKSTTRSYLKMLSVLTGLTINEQTELLKPEMNITTLNELINHRPELRFFDAQKSLFESQKSLLNAGNLPKIGLFVQGGYGKPGLNMLSNAFSNFYIGGLRFTWNLNGLYSQRNNIHKLDISKKNIDVQKETFLFNSDIKRMQLQTEIEKTQELITNDDEIIRLRENIKKAGTAKLEYGTWTVSDLIREINAESQARQVKSLHEIQLLLTVYQLKNNINN